MEQTTVVTSEGGDQKRHLLILKCCINTAF